MSRPRKRRSRKGSSAGASRRVDIWPKRGVRKGVGLVAPNGAAVPSTTEARQILKHARARFSGLPGFRFVAIGPKLRRGAATGGIALRVFVKRKRKKLPRNQMVPKRFRLPAGASGAMQTDVQSFGEVPRALALSCGSAVAGDGGNGRSGLVYVNKRGKKFFLTNSHVVTRRGLSGCLTLVNEIFAGGGRRVVGKVVRASPLRPGLNALDAAVVRIGAGVAAHPYRLVSGDLVQDEIASISSTAADRYFMLGQSGRIELGNPNYVATSSEVDVPGFGMCQFSSVYHFDVLSGQPQPGDSGSVIIAEAAGAKVAVAVFFAGTLPGGSGRNALAFDIEHVFESLRRMCA